jgi:hypothetical protein
MRPGCWRHVAKRTCSSSFALCSVRALLSPDISPALLERFLIEWSARGAYMTEPVEGWIRGAGERCVALGQEKLGRALITHAKHEAGHHLMTIEDARVLVRRWNARHAQQLDADALVAQAPTEAMRQYRQVHDEAMRARRGGLRHSIRPGFSSVTSPQRQTQCNHHLWCTRFDYQ